MDVVKFIKAAELAGLGPVELSRLSGVSRDLIWRVIRRGHRPKLATITKLAGAVGLRARDLALL